MTYARGAHDLDADLVLKFFWRFSVFECALKREGFLKKNRPNAQPDWVAFSTAIAGRFSSVNRRGFSEGVAALLALAPRKQVVRGGRLGWDPIYRMEGESDESYTLRLLRTVRNNLFHGGKYPDGPIDEIARNHEILCAAIVVLEGCYELHPGVQRWTHLAA